MVASIQKQLIAPTLVMDFNEVTIFIVFVLFCKQNQFKSIVYFYIFLFYKRIFL